MSVEHQPSGHETNERAQAELESLAAERLETLGTKTEQSPEARSERAEQAREAIKAHEAQPDPAAKATELAPPKPSFAARLDESVNYTHTMQSVQRRLTPVSRSFSKVIHNPSVEKTSEALEKTVLRPSVINGALWTAVVIEVVFYITARTYGFTLSGSEIIMAFLAGGLLGIVLEGIWRGLKRPR